MQMDFTISVAKTKVLISCTVTAQLSAASSFSHMQKSDFLMTRLKFFQLRPFHIYSSIPLHNVCYLVTRKSLVVVLHFGLYVSAR